MKALLILSMSSLLFFSSRAQPPAAQRPAGPKDTTFQSAFSTAIEAVLHDFPENLHHITGDLVMAEGEIENFTSTVAPPGAVNCTITRYHSVVDTTASWQARMSSHDDFGKAADAYHDLYKRLTNCYLRLADSSLIFLKGKWEPARESISFTTSSFRLGTDDPRYKGMRVELELVYQLSEWAVNINILSKRDDETGFPVQ